MQYHHEISYNYQYCHHFYSCPIPISNCPFTPVTHIHCQQYNLHWSLMFIFHGFHYTFAKWTCRTMYSTLLVHCTNGAVHRARARLRPHWGERSLETVLSLSPTGPSHMSYLWWTRKMRLKLLCWQKKGEEKARSHTTTRGNLERTLLHGALLVTGADSGVPVMWDFALNTQAVQ